MLSGIGQNNARLEREFYSRDVLVVAPELIGKTLIRCEDREINRYTIIETEAYRGEEDQASHARFGRTIRNSIMYGQAGMVYIYLVYGMHWMLNIVTGNAGIPQAVLIRSLKGLSGPGNLTRGLGIDKSFYGEDLVNSRRIWLETNSETPEIITGPRVGIEYSGEPWISHPWRFMWQSKPGII